jgi:hypothetical protein
MILTKSAVFKELNISLKHYELLKKDTDTGPLRFTEPQNEYALFSLILHMLNNGIYPVIQKRPVFEKPIRYEELIIWNLNWIAAEEDCYRYQRMLEEICHIYLNSDAQDWDGAYSVSNLNKAAHIFEGSCYQYTFQCQNKKLTCLFDDEDKILFNSFKLLMELSFQAAFYRHGKGIDFDFSF